MTSILKKKVDYLLANNDSMVQKSNTLLRSGKKFITLARNGDPTLAGKYYEQQTNTPLEADGYNLTQTPIREGNTEFVTLRSGKKVKTRIWNAISGEYRFTKEGNAFYKNLRRNYVVSIPVTVIGKRKNGTTYTVRSHMPIEKLGMTKKATSSQFDACRTQGKN